MPLYEYECAKDGRFELIRKFSDPPLSACPTCGQPIEKLFSSPAIQFKGTGWYITDYARKGKDQGKDKDSSSSKESGKDSSKDSAKDGSKDSGSKESSSKSDSSPKTTPSPKEAASGGSSTK